MQPRDAKFLLDFFLPQLVFEQTRTKAVLLAIPPNQGDYRPAPQSRSTFELGRHLAGTEMWFLDGVLNHEFAEDDNLEADLPKTVAGFADWYDRHFFARLPRLEALSGEHLAVPVNYIGVRNDPAVTYLSLTLRHTAHHRGQLSAYLRPIGAKVPAIYIESADASLRSIA
jgi:uncharacterized damage-inducible protein DinB